MYTMYGNTRKYCEATGCLLISAIPYGGERFECEVAAVHTVLPQYVSTCPVTVGWQSPFYGWPRRLPCGV